MQKNGRNMFLYRPTNDATDLGTRAPPRGANLGLSLAGVGGLAESECTIIEDGVHANLNGSPTNIYGTALPYMERVKKQPSRKKSMCYPAK